MYVCKCMGILPSHYPKMNHFAGQGIYLVLLHFKCSKTMKGTPRGYSHTLPIRVCAAQRGHDFEASDLERGIHFRGVS